MKTGFGSVVMFCCLAAIGCKENSGTTVAAQDKENSKQSIVGRWEYEDFATTLVIDSDKIKSYYREEERDYPSGDYRLISDGVGLLDVGGEEEEFYFKVDDNKLFIRFLRAGELEFFRK